MSAVVFEKLAAAAQVLERDSQGPKVMRLASGQIAKLFRPPRLLSSSTLRPYALRFARAARGLAQRNIPSVHVEAVYRLAPSRRHVVVYQPVAGCTLRDALRDSLDDAASLLMRYTALLALLHRKGVVFRSVHFGNVILRPEGDAALIDISATRFCRRPLSLRQRAKNFRAPLNYEDDTAAIAAMGAEKYVSSYCDAAGLDSDARKQLAARLRRQSLFWREELA